MYSREVIKKGEKMRYHCPNCHNEFPVIEEVDDIVADLRRQLAEKDKQIGSETEVFLTTIESQGKELERLRKNMEQIAITIKGIRPHFVNTGLTCLEDCDYILSLTTKE